jgi:hypothetical protein
MQVKTHVKAGGEVQVQRARFQWLQVQRATGDAL